MEAEKKVEEFIKVLKTDEWRKNIPVLKKLGEPAVKSLIQALRQGAWNVRWRAAGALGAMSLS